MKNLFNYWTILCIALLISLSVTSCSDSPSSSEPEEFGDVSIANISSGDILSGEVSIDVSTSGSNIDEVKLYIRGEEAYSTSSAQSSFNLSTREYSNGDTELKVVGISSGEEVAEKIYNTEFENYLFQWDAQQFLEERTDFYATNQLKVFISKTDGTVLDVYNLKEYGEGLVRLGAPEDLDFELPDEVVFTVFIDGRVKSVIDIDPWQTFTSNDINVSKNIVESSNVISPFDQNFQSQVSKSDMVANNTEGGVEVILEDIEVIGNSMEIRVHGESDWNGMSFNTNADGEVVKSWDEEDGWEVIESSETHFSIRVTLNENSENEDIALVFKVNGDETHEYTRYWVVESFKDEDSHVLKYETNFGVLEESEISVDERLHSDNYGVGYSGTFQTQNGSKFSFSGSNFVNGSFYRYTPSTLKFATNSVSASDFQSNYEWHAFFSDEEVITDFDLLNVDFSIVNENVQNFQLDTSGKYTYHEIRYVINSGTGGSQWLEWSVITTKENKQFSFPDIDEHVNYYTIKDLELLMVGFEQVSEIGDPNDLLRYYLSEIGGYEGFGLNRKLSQYSYGLDDLN